MVDSQWPKQPEEAFSGWLDQLDDEVRRISPKCVHCISLAYLWALARLVCVGGLHQALALHARAQPPHLQGTAQRGRTAEIFAARGGARIFQSSPLSQIVQFSPAWVTVVLLGAGRRQ